MKSKFDLVEFGEIYSDEGSRNGLTKPKKVRGEGFKMINMGELFEYDRMYDPPAERVPLDEREREKYTLQEGDLLFARQSLKREGAGKCSIVQELSEPTTWEGHLIRVRLDKGKAHPLFYYYLFSSSRGKKLMQTIVNQVAAAGIRGSDLVNLKVPKPPLPIQRRIADILGALDDKIELNRRMNETLEAMAQALYRHWFVDFGPFQDRDFTDTEELGPIPKGWGVSDADKYAEVQYGTSFSSDYFNDEGEGWPLIKNGDLKTHDPDSFTTEDTSGTILIEPGDVVVSMDGQFRSHIWKGPESLLNQRVCTFRPRQDHYRGYIYFAIKRPLEYYENAKTGTTVKHLNKGDIRQFRLVDPPSSVIEQFASHVEPLLDHIAHNSQENRTLAETRDYLLPKLISGEIEVEAAEEIADERAAAQA
jgi:type I restriction enzyme S subunit